MSAPTPETYRDSLVEDRPDERLPYHWDGPEERSEGVFMPRVFIGSGYNAHTEPGDEPEPELALLFTGRAPMHPEDFTQTWMELASDLETVQRLKNLWLLRVRSVRNGSPILPDLTPSQRRLVEDVLLAFLAFSRPSESSSDRLEAEDWPLFYAELTRGVPIGAFIRAESHLERVQAWLYARYSDRLYGHIPLAERETIASNAAQQQ
ncbi:hypothetical protein OH76DRAFT_1486012 [Lentinus brumalis]|uniref:Uncharacterized protein n=1 Tax=Lentinus brumalis TaxID=2498619 RepID=A0A371D010_9APHY|nr:hypothetical protein OH76DRAFT_1486012 [Polyporus brumalis]